MKKSGMKSRTVIFYTALVVSMFYMASSTLGMDRINIQGGISLYPDPRNGPDIYVEFPYAVHRNQFTFLPGKDPDEGLIGGIYAEIVLSDGYSKAIDSSSITFYIGANDSLDVQDEDIRIFDRLSLMIPPGVYSARLTVIDIVGKGEGSFLYDRLEIDPVVSDRLNLSSLELAYRIRTVEDSAARYIERLIKNDREVIPNPMGVFSEEDTSLYAYAELYNLAYEGIAADSFSLNYHIFTAKGDSYFDFGDLHQIKPGSSAVLTNVLNISGFEPDRYNLRLIARDFGSGLADTASTRFIIFPRIGALEFAPVTTIKHPYDTAGLETKRHLTKYLMAPQQLAMLKTLNDSGKVRFINQFFKDKDPDPFTEVNEFLDDIFNRYVFANKNFSTMSGKNDGWSTDRGRVLLQYKAWDDREEAIAPSLGKPWELWSYYSLEGEGGVVFVFQDIDGYGDYWLVHSNAKGEIFDPEWDQFLKNYDPKTYKEGFILPDLRKD